MALTGVLWAGVLFPAFAQFTDDFSDGDFSANPEWVGHTDRFIVDAQQRLQLSAPPENNTSYLSTPSQAINDAAWEFWVRFGFNPSSSNFGRVYLVASSPDLTGALNGYYVRLGGETQDRITLYRQSNTTSSSLITSQDGILGSDPVEVRIRVTRDAEGNWELFADSTGGSDFQSLGTAFDDTHQQSFHSGVWCRYTATRSDKFWFDDFNVSGSWVIDNDPPLVNSVSIVSETQLLVQFSEPVTAVTAENTLHYEADNGLGNPALAERPSSTPSQVTLTFGTEFTHATTYALIVSGVQDLAGNTLAPSTFTFTYAIPEPAEYRDLVINEFMADENPSIGMPEYEFVEIYNRSAKFINLTGWKLCDNSSCGNIQPHVIAPGDYAILVQTSAVGPFQQSFFNNVVQVTSWAALNNAGDDIILKDTEENVIDGLSYTTAWYKDPTKSGGGYSIEQVNPYLACSGFANWRATENIFGGTPGSVNSVFDNSPDVVGPSLVEVRAIGPQTVEVRMSEPIETATLSTGSIAISPSNTVLMVEAIAPEFDRIHILFDAPLDTGVTQTLTITGLADCEGNAQQGNSTGSFLIPFTMWPGDLVINEVLFNPYTGGRDYVELYNRTDRPVNLRGCLLANFANDTISNLRLISSVNRAVPPKGFVCLTQDTLDVMGKYINHGIGTFVQMTSLPSYNNSDGMVIMLSSDTVVMEYFTYDEKMHFPLLSDVKGVSLERLDPDRDVNDRGNWHSASQTVGFGTPGLENSQLFVTGGVQGEVSTEPAIFSPDNDGHQDVLNILYRFDTPGSVGTIRIFDSNGRLVRILIQNELLGMEGVYTWDGTTDGTTKGRIGIYIILFEVFDASGTSRTFKLSTVLGGRL